MSAMRAGCMSVASVERRSVVFSIALKERTLLLELVVLHRTETARDSCVKGGQGSPDLPTHGITISAGPQCAAAALQSIQCAPSWRAESVHQPEVGAREVDARIPLVPFAPMRLKDRRQPRELLACSCLGRRTTAPRPEAVRQRLERRWSGDRILPNSC